jgi:predicted PurR-regulated permease PerM
MDLSWRGALWIIAAGVIAAGLYFLREPLTQFALAFLLWLAIQGLTEALDARMRFLPRAAILPIAFVIVLGLVALIGYVVIANIGAMSKDFGTYESHLDDVIAQGYALFGVTEHVPTFRDLIARLNPEQVAQQVGSSLQNLASDVTFILLYLAFLFPAAGALSQKLDYIFGGGQEREQARLVIEHIRDSMEQYLWVQTVISLIITALTYATLLIGGVQNALFWSFVIFFLNYIPTIGSIVAVVAVAAVALVQFSSLPHVAAVTIATSAWQFLIGNFIQPRMTGKSLNLSSLIVLLALAIWGAMWGIAGAFLAAPLTVMLMIVLAQFPKTRWIAILLSADGKPTSSKPIPSM